jgi:hypothetical protein
VNERDHLRLYRRVGHDGGPACWRVPCGVLGGQDTWSMYSRTSLVGDDPESDV